MNGPTAAVVIFFLLMCVKRLLLSLTPLLRYDTHTHTFTLSLVSPWLFPPSFSFFLFVLLIFKFFIDFFFFLSFFFNFSLIFFSFMPAFFSFFLFFFFFLNLFLSWALSHLSMHVLVMSIDSNFVFEFIA